MQRTQRTLYVGNVIILGVNMSKEFTIKWRGKDLPCKLHKRHGNSYLRILLNIDGHIFTIE